MEKRELYGIFEKILEQELVPAMGCTEPIALAYCAAVARKELGCLPDRVLVEVSGNIIKNAKSVIVPSTNGARGIVAAAAIGIVAGKVELQLEVLSRISNEEKEAFQEYMKKVPFEVRQLESTLPLDIQITVWKGENSAGARIAGSHTNLVSLMKNGIVQKVDSQKEEKSGEKQPKEDPYDLLSMEAIYEFVNEEDLEKVKPVLERQITYNRRISQEGLSGNYGANIGSVIRSCYGNDVRSRALAAAAAGSDARMNGCELPVVINSGSGNQGLTVSLPVLEYAKELQASEEKLYRALLLSNLVAIHLKHGIGTLSAYCGAVSAGAAAGAGIAYLKGGDYKTITHTIVNALAITSGIVCDGAKSSCAAKIATAVESGIFGYEMYRQGQQFYGGDGIVSKGIENTIRNIAILGRDGMRETDRQILGIMLEN